MSPGDLIFYRDETYGVHRWWEVLSCCHGGTGQEGLIELCCLTEKPGQSVDGKLHQTTWVPAVLLRHMPVYVSPQRFREMDEARLAAERKVVALYKELQRYQDVERFVRALGTSTDKGTTP